MDNSGGNYPNYHYQPQQGNQQPGTAAGGGQAFYSPNPSGHWSQNPNAGASSQWSQPSGQSMHAAQMHTQSQSQGQSQFSPQQHATSQPQQPQIGQMFNEFSNNPMAGFAVNQAADFIQKGTMRYMPGAYGAWGSLKYYFAVNNTYVLQKLKVLLLPFRHKNWRRHQLHDQSQEMPKFAPPSSDINAPDLYIPLMSFVLYILIVGFIKGSSGEFSPDVIGEVAGYLTTMQLLEIGLIMSVLYLVNSSTSFLDLVSFTGYKYICLVINVTIHILFGAIFYYIALAYTSLAMGYFMLNCMKGSIPVPSQQKRKTTNYIIAGVAVLQMVIIWWNAYK